MVVKFRANIHDDPSIKNLLSSMPDDVKKSFSEEQLMHLKTAIVSRTWAHHPVDLRGTIKGFRHRYYYVFLAGKNRREISREAEKLSRMLRAAIISGCLLFSMLLGLITLYVVKSALGINLFDSFSLGFWDWLNNR